MTKFESGVKVVPASQEAVYEKLSDLSNLEKVKDILEVLGRISDTVAVEDAGTKATDGVVDSDLIIDRGQL